MPIIRFVISLSGLTALVYGLALLLQKYFTNVLLISSAFPLILGFLYGLTLIVFILSYIGIKSSAETGVLALLGGSVLKLLFALIFVFFMFRKYPENQIVLALNFFSVYFLFTIFEVTVLLLILRDQKKT